MGGGMESNDNYRTTIIISKADAELARLKGIEVSKLLREALHSMVNNDENLDKDQAQLETDLAHARLARAEAEQKIKVTEARLKKIEEQRVLQRQNEERIKAERDKEKGLCVMCNSLLNIRVVNGFVTGGTSIKKGEHVGRYVCSSCFEQAYSQHKKEWFV